MRRLKALPYGQESLRGCVSSQYSSECQASEPKETQSNSIPLKLANRFAVIPINIPVGFVFVVLYRGVLYNAKRQTK